jgi:hypothetical protein
MVEFAVKTPSGLPTLVYKGNSSNMDVVPNLRTSIPPMAICVTETRSLRWTFRRNQDAVVCELGLNSDDSAYELRLNPPWNLRETTTEVFDDAMQAFQRHAAIERVLIDEGWMLEGFETVIGATLAQSSLGG